MNSKTHDLKMHAFIYLFIYFRLLKDRLTIDGAKMSRALEQHANFIGTCVCSVQLRIRLSGGK